MTNEDDRQRLRQRTVQSAKDRESWRDTHPGMFPPWVGGVLAMESLLTEAEARVRELESECDDLDEDRVFAIVWAMKREAEVENLRALDAAEQEEGT